MLERVLGAVVAVPFALGTAAAAPGPGDGGEVVFSFRDEAVVESSGLVVTGGLVVTTNDSGDTGRLYVVDPATGETVGTTDWSTDPTDVEALAPGPAGTVWVGDIGDNRSARDHVEVAAVPVGRGAREVDAPTFDLVYPDGAHDAETLLSDPTTGRLYVVTKSALGGTLYAAPQPLDASAPNPLRPAGEVLPLATDGAFLADGARLVVRNYATAAVYAFPSLEVLGRLRLPEQPQGEGLAVDADGSLLLSSEGVGAAVLRVAVPAPAPPVASASPVDGPESGPRTRSREDRELPETTETERPAWPWFLSGFIGVGVIATLAFALRRR